MGEAFSGELGVPRLQHIPMNSTTVVESDSPKAIRIDGYLTESKLSKALQGILPDAWLGDQVRVADSRQRWDMSYQIDGAITVVEYDGDEHYRNSMKIKGDRAKDEVARTHGLRVVRFPYWVQLDSLTFTTNCSNGNGFSSSGQSGMDFRKPSALPEMKSTAVSGRSSRMCR